MTRLVLSAALAAFLLAACATAPPAYAPAAASGQAGYSETQLESNRYFVTFRAPNGADPAVLEDYALLRAADLTLENGREWFWVDRRTIDGEVIRDDGPRLGVGVGGGSYSGGWGGGSGGGVGIGLSLPLGGSSASANAATLEIRFGEGPKPDEANAYDARSISTNLRAQANPG